MAYIAAHFLHIFIAISSISFPVIFTATVIEDLNNLQPPPDFKSTITNNCLRTPSLRYCNASPFDLHEIFKFTIVASHLCNISSNPKCVETFPKIDLHGRPKIAPLYLSFTFFWKYCPLTILSIDLSNNSLKGDFPTDIFYCSQIQALDLSLNHLSGDVPIQNLSTLENLTFLNLSYNGFSECKISETHFFKRFNSSSFIHSGLLPNHTEFRIKAALLLVGFPVFVITIVVFLGWLCFLRPDLQPGFLQSKHKFTPSTLEAATDGFSKRNLVGKTGRSSIYRGVLRDRGDVRIEIYLHNMTGEKHRRFVEESGVLVQLHHKNVVPFQGWCDSRRFKAIVNEWKGGDNLEKWLETSAPPWRQRAQIILGIASAICYLQEEWPQVGYSLKTRNIVVSEDGEPLITRLRLDRVSRKSTRKTYKFGLFMLEMATNRRPMEEFENKETGFVEWVKLNYPENLENVIDRRMEKTADEVSEATAVVEFGLICTDLSSSRQPSWDRFCNLLSNISSAVSESHERVHHHREL